MLQQIFLSIVGFCSGIIIAGGVVGLLIGLSIVPRYAGITHTGKHILFYLDMKILRFLALYVVIFFSSMAGTFQAEPLLCSFMDFFPVSSWADGSWHLLRWQMFSPSFPEGSN